MDSLHLFKKILKSIISRTQYCTYLTIDPGARNIGMVLSTIIPYRIIDTKHFTNKTEQDKYGCDNRLYFTSLQIEQYIIQYNPNFIVIEQNTFSLGKFSFAENILLKNIGLIMGTIRREFIPMLSISLHQCKKILGVKANRKEGLTNKDVIKLFILENKILPPTKKQDLYDAAFISFAIHGLYQDKIL